MAIIQINTLWELDKYIKTFKHVPKKPLLYLDIDDTIMKSRASICPNHEFSREMQVNIGEGVFKVKGHRFWSYHHPKYLDLVKRYNEAVVTHKWDPVEVYITAEIMRRLNNTDIPYKFLTARGTEIHRPTIRWLKRLMLYPKPHTSQHANHVHDFPNVTGRSGMRGKIIYCGGYSKYLTLLENGLRTKNIILVDDNISNLIEFEQNLKGKGFVGVHYVKKT